MLEQVRSNKFLVSVGLGLLLMAIIYLEQEFINKNENNKFDLVTYVKAGFVGFTISFLALYVYKPSSFTSSALAIIKKPIEKILTGNPPF